MKLKEFKINPNFDVCKGMEIRKNEFLEMKKQIEDLITNINEYAFMAHYARELDDMVLAHLYEYKLNEYKENLKDVIKLNKEYYIIKVEV